MAGLKKSNLNSIVELRTTTDDNLPNSLSELGYTQSFAFTDSQLAIGLVTVSLAGILFLLDKKYEFDEIYTFTIVLIVLYFTLSSVLYYFKSAKKYKDVKYIGYDDKGNKITIKSYSPKFEPLYKVTVILGHNVKETEFDINYSELFDAFGHFRQDELTARIKKEIAQLQKK
ncbi:Piso0_002608 [Millerozyma farinosa CBS 7064]|uniref:Signal peptidase complex subunit 2 n=1 Tax=Pichia sorbitophila (strain ATCC MYA-4447 / BCRC 22081 / CBS 7064 / NBRC 10061 / NRRL Y-12695) TaxID=559304 RepID=G8YFH9_PICSO|nr:Piso0_002608 [Millerozyma farinosa CBS 7064]